MDGWLMYIIKGRKKYAKMKYFSSSWVIDNFITIWLSHIALDFYHCPLDQSAKATQLQVFLDSRTKLKLCWLAGETADWLRVLVALKDNCFPALKGLVSQPSTCNSHAPFWPRWAPAPTGERRRRNTYTHKNNKLSKKSK